LPRARATLLVKARAAGHVRDIDPLELGLVSVALGAGRSRAEASVDPSAGIELLAKVGTAVVRGQPLARLHAQRSSLVESQAARALGAFAVGQRPGRAQKLLLERLR
jgi:thymidine phosphorylase